MFELFDSHIHLFENGYKNSGSNELAEYEKFRTEHSINTALVIGYEGQSWAHGNNEYLRGVSQNSAWIKPLAFVHLEKFMLSNLDDFLQQGFIGISLYIFSDSEVSLLQNVDARVWSWLSENKWIVSVNSKGDYWQVWQEILRNFPNLNLFISHLGLPKIEVANPTNIEISSEFKVIESLSSYKNVFLKLSGFYALEPNVPQYPYQSVKPYIRYILEKFDLSRLVWGSDFSPALEVVPFDKTYAHLNEWDFISSEARQDILGNNLKKLIENRAK